MELLSKIGLDGSQFKSEMGDCRNEVKDTASVIEKGSKSVSEMAKQMHSAGASSNNYIKQLKSLTREISDLTVNYRLMSDAEKKGASGQELANKINVLTQKAGFLKDAIADAKNAIKSQASDTQVFDAIGQGLNVAKSGLESFITLTAGANTSSEKFQQTMTKLAQVETSFSAATKIVNAVQKHSALIQGLVTLKTNLMSASFVGAKVAAKGLAVAIKAIPFIGWAAAIASVVASLVNLTKSMGDAEDKAGDLKDKLKEQCGSLADNQVLLLKLQKEWKNLKTEEEKAQFLKDRKSDLDNLTTTMGDNVQAIDNISTADKVFSENTKAIVDAFNLRAEAAGNAAAAVALYTKAAEKEIELQDVNKQLENIKITIKDTSSSSVWDKINKAMAAGSSVTGANYAGGANYGYGDNPEQYRLNKQKEDLTKEIADLKAKAGDLLDRQIELLSQADKNIESAGINLHKSGGGKSGGGKSGGGKSGGGKSGGGKSDNDKSKPDKDKVDESAEALKKYLLALSSTKDLYEKNSLTLEEYYKRLCDAKKEYLSFLEAKTNDKGEHSEEDLNNIQELRSNIAWYEDELEKISKAKEQIGEPGSLNFLSTVLSALMDDLEKLTPGTEEWKKKLEEVKVASDNLSKAQKLLDDTMNPIIKGTLGDYKRQLDDLEEALQRVQVGSKEYYDIQKKIDTIQKKVDKHKPNFNETVSAFGNLTSGINGTIESWSWLDKEFENMNGWQKFASIVDKVINTLSTLSSVIESVSTILSLFSTTTSAATAIEETAATTTGTNAVAKDTEAAATVALTAAKTADYSADVAGITAVTAAAAAALPGLTAKSIANQIMTATENTAAYASIPFAGPGLAAAAMAIYQGLWAAAAVPMLAKGGIVEGATSLGDRIPIRVNKGEMVLNTAQQTHLFRMLNNNVTNGVNQPQNVKFVIKGSELHGVLANYNSKKNKV